MDEPYTLCRVAAELAQRRSLTAATLARQVLSTGGAPDLIALAQAVVALSDAVSAVVLAPLPSTAE